jgi:hypothetical protein
LAHPSAKRAVTPKKQTRPKKALPNPNTPPVTQKKPTNKPNTKSTSFAKAIPSASGSKPNLQANAAASKGKKKKAPNLPQPKTYVFGQSSTDKERDKEIAELDLLLKQNPELRWYMLYD